MLLQQKKPMKKVFVNSLPKSGTNLVAKCLELMGYVESGGLDASLVSDLKIRSYLRSVYYRAIFSTGYMVGIDLPVEISRWAVNRILDRAESYNYVAGHIGYSAEILDLIKQKGFAPLLIRRDPRAVLNSFVHYVVNNRRHVLHKYLKDKSVSDRYHIALYGVNTGCIHLQSLLKRCNATDAWVADSDVLKLKFEDLVGSSGGGSDDIQRHSLSAMASFVGIKGFDVQSISGDVFGAGRHTFRKGFIHAWKEEMPASIQEEVNEVMHAVLLNWGYET